MRQGTLVAMADGSAPLSVEHVCSGMLLVGVNGKIVRVKDVEEKEVEETYTIVTERGNYTVSANHRVTLRINSNPVVTIEQGKTSELVQLRLGYRSRKGPLVNHQTSWIVEPSDEPPAKERKKGAAGAAAEADDDDDEDVDFDLVVAAQEEAGRSEVRKHRQRREA